MENLLNDIAAYGFAIAPLALLFIWTIWGNWYTYDLGWMIMSLDIGLWMIAWPNTARHLFHTLNVTTSGWHWYFTCAQYIVLVMMIWRGFKIVKTLFKEDSDDRERELRD